MNEKNYEYLTNQLKYTGFEGLDSQLKAKLDQQLSQFTLSHQAKFGNDTVNCDLNFTKSNKTDMYFFNNYQIHLQKENSKENLKQTFYINSKGDHNFSLDEAYNLMSERCVRKTLVDKNDQLYNAWVQINFTDAYSNGNYKLHQYRTEYGFSLNAALEKHPIKELGNLPDKLNLLNSLEKGNRQPVTFQLQGKEEIRFIEANPQFKSINIYDSNHQRLRHKQVNGEKQVPEDNTQRQNAKKESQSAENDDGPDMPASKKKRSRKQSNSI